MTKEIVMFAFSDVPVRIIWITRKGKELKEDTVTYHDILISAVDSQETPAMADDTQHDADYAAVGDCSCNKCNPYTPAMADDALHTLNAALTNRSYRVCRRRQ